MAKKRKDYDLFLSALFKAKNPRDCQNILKGANVEHLRQLGTLIKKISTGKLKDKHLNEHSKKKLGPFRDAIDEFRNNSFYKINR